MSRWGHCYRNRDETGEFYLRTADHKLARRLGVGLGLELRLGLGHIHSDLQSASQWSVVIGILIPDVTTGTLAGSGAVQFFIACVCVSLDRVC